MAFLSSRKLLYQAIPGAQQISAHAKGLPCKLSHEQSMIPLFPLASSGPLVGFIRAVLHANTGNGLAYAAPSSCVWTPPHRWKHHV